jgi:hypothetical protein
MEYSRGEWVELVEDTWGFPAGTKAKVLRGSSSWGFRIGVPPGVVVERVSADKLAPTEPPESASSGYAVVGLVGLASAVAATVVAVSRARWGA